MRFCGSTASTSIAFRRSKCRPRKRRIRTTSWGTARWSFSSPEHKRWSRDFSPRAEDLPIDRRDLPAARRHTAGHRVRRGARRHAWHSAGGHRPARSLRAVDRRAPHRAAAASDAACHARLELCAAAGSGTAVAASPGRLPRRLHPRCGCRRSCSDTGYRRVSRCGEVSPVSSPKSLVAFDRSGDTRPLAPARNDPGLCAREARRSGEIDGARRRHAAYYSRSLCAAGLGSGSRLTR